MKEMPGRIYLCDCNEAMTTPLEGDTEYIRKDIVAELIKTAEDWVAIAAAKTYLQENPVTPVWHDASEKPADAINTLVMTGEGHFVVAAYFYKKSIIGKDMWMWADGFPVGEAENGNTIYSSWCELNENDIVKWAYVDDLLKVTHSVIKISDQEPKTEYVLYGVDGRNPQEDKDTNPFDVEVERYRKEKGADNIRYYECARHFAEWQKQQMIKDAIEREVKVQPTFVPKFRIGQRIRHKGGLGAFKIDRIVGMQYVGENGEKVGIVVQDDWELVEEPVSDDLDVLIKDLQEHYRCTKGYPATFYASNIEFVVRHVAEWQKQQLMKDVVEAEYWDGSLFKNELRERFKDGDKVKLIIIKENEKVIKS